MGYLDQTIRISVDISKETKAMLISLLKQLSNVFGWQLADMIGVDNKVI